MFAIDCLFSIAPSTDPACGQYRSVLLVGVLAVQLDNGAEVLAQFNHSLSDAGGHTGYARILGQHVVG